MVEQITETYATVEAKQVAGKPGRLELQLISAGVGSSGYYAPDVLEAAVNDKVFSKGTHIYFDHPSASENADRPERSVRDLAAVLSEDATWDAEGNAVIGEADIIGPYRDLLADPVFQSAVGMSIRASADVSEGEHNGRRTRIVDKLIESQSVDVVTRAGRGGMILGVLESARPSQVLARAVGHGVSEATVNDKREALDDVLKSTHGGERVWVWLRDFDDTTAWFEVSTDDSEATYAQSYETGDNGLATAMTGERTEVRQVTQYVPVSPAGQPNTQESKEDTMASTQIEESALADLREKAGRVTTLESERDTAIKERDNARAELAESKRHVRMDALIAEADHTVSPLEAKGLKADAKVKENGDLDEDAFKTAIAEAAASIAEANGAGTPRGNGKRPQSVPEVSEADLDQLDDAVYGAVKEA